ncbi:MAG: thiamine biosynthesis protein ApbE [Chloroflexi bacterium RBG_19FT_COMBO_48_23]|nr:MAG: thiamine biosynthesis protein ApbE [Chloroflexi bacterium RBG_19FT_COMBO_48_23]
MYQPRVYRRWIKDDDLVSFDVAVKETDLYIRAASKLEAEAIEAVIKSRTPLEEYIKSHPLFLHSLEPCSVEDDAPAIVRDMAKAARIAGVGPMAAVAGAIAEAVGKDLLAHSPEIIVENGGDIFIKISRPRLIGVYAAASSLTGKIALEINPQETPLGVCTSSGTVGHSLSLGAADAVIALSCSTALADAAATAIGNMVRTADDINVAIEQAQAIDGLTGVIVIKDDRMGMWGSVKLASV